MSPKSYLSCGALSSLFAVVPAAGCGVRFGSDKSSKTLCVLDNSEITVLELSVIALVRSGVCNGVVVAARSQEVELFKSKFDSLECGVPIEVVQGGSTRQESVYLALKHLPDNVAFVAIHDAARPLCVPSDVCAVFNAAKKHGSAILASRVSLTLKRCGEVAKSDATKDDDLSFHVLETISRNNMWAAQTPQVFARNIIQEAYERALVDSYLGTDDSELVERLGHKVFIVEGSSINIKITTKEDLVLARALSASLGESDTVPKKLK